MPGTGTNVVNINKLGVGRRKESHASNFRKILKAFLSGALIYILFHIRMMSAECFAVPNAQRELGSRH